MTQIAFKDNDHYKDGGKNVNKTSGRNSLFFAENLIHTGVLPNIYTYNLK